MRGITSYAAGGTGRRSRSPLGTRAWLVPLGDKIGCVCRFISFTSFMKPRREPAARTSTFLDLWSAFPSDNTSKGSRRGCNGDGGALASAGHELDYHRYYALLARLCTTMQGANRQISERRPPNRGNSACIDKVKPTNSNSNFVHETSRAHLRFRCDPASWLPPLFPSKW
jgi:hypothetical protein